jgi:O-antigen/teichoic acid export membrane protein
MFILAAAAVFNVSANLIFIPFFSYLAAAIISATTELLVALAAGYLVFRRLQYVPKIEKIGGILLAGAVMTAFLFVLRGGNFYLLGFSSVCVYVLALWLFRAVETSEITSIISKKGIKEYEKPISES